MDTNTAIKKLQEPLTGLLRSYSAVVFGTSAKVGVLCLASTFWYPNAGGAGLIAAIVGMVTAKIMRFPNLKSGLHIYSSLLVGLSLGIAYRLDIYLLVLIFLGAVFAVFFSVAVADSLWKIEKLPALSLPFVVVSLATGFAAQGYGTLTRYLYPLVSHDVLFTAEIDQFFVAFGSTFFSPHPVAGLLVFSAVFVTSRYLALLAVAGFVCGHTIYQFLSGNVHPDLVNWTGFNFILTAMAIGGIFTVPSWQSFTLAMAAAGLAALLTAATESFMYLYGLPVMAIPYIVTTFTVLVALQKRYTVTPPKLLLDSPALPEVSYERERLALARGGDINSVPVFAPIMGKWQIYQGFNDRHTHQPPWQHALDFYINDSGQSFSNDGSSLADYYCFDLPVISPVYGQVIRIVNHIEDNSPGQVNTKDNWGNFILIRMQSGLHVLLAHLRKDSVLVHESQFVEPTDMLASCGNSGRSPQPHLHLQVQSGATLGSPTHPFHLTTVIQQDSASVLPMFRLVARPAVGSTISNPHSDVNLYNALHLPIGRCLHYSLQSKENKTLLVQLTSALSLVGVHYLKSDTGASCEIDDNVNVLSFYNRNRVQDSFMDLWMLALGVTPFANGALQWKDAPSMKLFPLTKRQCLVTSVLKPLGGGLDSDYQRDWDSEKSVWNQTCIHTLNLLGGISWQVKTLAVLSPERGCIKLRIWGNQYELSADLQATGLTADEGIPEWHSSV